MTFSDIASVFSILGAVIALFTFLRVASLKSAILDHSIKRRLEKMFSSIENIPSSKQKLTNSQVRDITEILDYMNMFYISELIWNNRKEKGLINKIKEEIQNDRNTQNVKNAMSILRDHLFIKG